MSARPDGNGRARPSLVLAPIVFLAHDLEETWRVATMNERAREVRRRLPGPIARRVERLRYTHRAMATAAATLFVAQVCLLAASSRSERGRRLLQLALLLRLLNGTAHLAETAVMRRYVPGVATSPAVMAAAGLALRAISRPAAPAAP